MVRLSPLIGNESREWDNCDHVGGPAKQNLGKLLGVVATFRLTLRRFVKHFDTSNLAVCGEAERRLGYCICEVSNQLAAFWDLTWI